MNSKPSGLSTLLSLFAYLGGVVLLACLISPPLFWIGTWLADAGMLPVVKGFPFHRYFSRSIQVSAIVLLWPAFRRIGVRGMADLGLHRNIDWLRDLAAGFSLAFVPVALLGVTYIFTGVYSLKASFDASGFLRIAGSATVVSIVEEFLFRGVLLGLAVAAMPRKWAAILSAFIFAIVHFMKTSRASVDLPVDWASGFAQLPYVFSSAPPWPLSGWGFLSLFVAGLLLAWTVLQTRSLFLPIGLHSGWIFAQQSLQRIAQFSPKPIDEFLPWVGPNVVSGAVPTGIVPVLVLLFTCVIVWIFLHRDQRFS